MGREGGEDAVEAVGVEIGIGNGMVNESLVWESGRKEKRREEKKKARRVI